MRRAAGFFSAFAGLLVAIYGLIGIAFGDSYEMPRAIFLLIGMVVIVLGLVLLGIGLSLIRATKRSPV
jgi:hypothetical protein